jgi:ribose transport system permease protein
MTTGRLPTGLIAVTSLLLLLLALGAALSRSFIQPGNLLNVLEQATDLAIVGLGQTVVVLTGGIDLSVGSLISLLAVLTSGLIDSDASMVLPVVAGVIVLGALLGAINGLTVVWLRVHPLIVTLGSGAVLQGITLLYAKGPVGGVPDGFDFLAYGRVLGLPVAGVAVLLVFVIAALLLRLTPFGRYVYAVGDDPVAASLMGLPRRRVLVVAYAVSGACSALAAIYLVARFGSGQPYTGANYTLASITPVVVGGTVLAGGRGGVMGTLLGAYLVAVLNNLLNFLDVSSQMQLVVQGLIIILAVSVVIDKRRVVA